MIIDEILRLQKIAIERANPPFSSVIIKEDVIISSAVNDSRTTRNPLRHAEITAIQTAIDSHGASVLKGAQLYSSNEPCPMCVGASIWSGIARMVYFLSQQQIEAIRGWGRFTNAKSIAKDDDSGIKIDGPIGNDKMLLFHKDFWESNGNSDFRHSIHLA